MRLRSGNAVASSIRATSVPNTSIEPAVGWINIAISRSRVDLPLPLPPTIASTSPRTTSSSIRSSTRFCSNCIVTSRTGTSVVASGAGADTSDTQVIERDRERSVDHDDEKDRLHDANGRLSAHTFRAAGRLEALKAADQRDQHSE